ncbi:MAG: PepSY-associated TM helix domain-containing protein, partial [Steroidobacterales bacterium]
MKIAPFDYRAVWRWHFYAGLFCIPFIVLLSITGSIYLFKPQIEAALDRPYDGLRLTAPTAGAGRQVLAALAAVPGGQLDAYELPVRANDAARVIVRDATGEAQRVYVHPQTLQVLAVVPERDRPMQVIKRIHGELLMGDGGSIAVELAASWAIVMIVTGLYLWWPRKERAATARFAGILYPRLRASGRTFWRDLHAVTGVWVSVLALF